MTIRRMVAGRLTRVAAAAGLAGVLAAVPAAGASPVAGTPAVTASAWRMQAPPEPAGTIDQGFDGVSCSSSSACLAIGSNSFPGNDDLGEFAETWTGSRWRVRTVPNGTGEVYLEAVTCRGARWCVAVGGIQAVSEPGGYQVPVADGWNGSTWKQVKLPVPAGAANSALDSVACSGTAACTAIGQSVNGGEAQSLLAERWNGSSWKVQPVPAPPGGGGTLEGVACPAARACRAVGYDNEGVLAEFWNGSSWAAVPAPRPAGGSLPALSAVSCTAAGSCEAVGTYQSDRNLNWYSLAEVWNGSRWRIQATPAISGATSAALDAVSCVSATDCEAGGYVQTKGGSVSFGVLENWNGSKWSVQDKLPTRPNPSRVAGISCTAGPVCEAVGFHVRRDGGGGHLLAMRYSSR